MGKELIFQTLRHEKTDEIPWIPFAGVHAGLLKGYSAKEVLTDSDKLVEALIETNKIYTPDGQPVVFDLQIEAEILGCELRWADDNPPSVTSHPWAGAAKGIPCDCRIPDETSGRIPVVLDAMKRVKKEIGDNTALYGLICGPFTLASHLRGTDIFMDMMSDAQYVRDLIAFCSKVAIKMAGMYLDAGMDVIAVVDPMVSQISPKMIDKLLSDGFRSVFDYIRARGAFSSFFVCGNATKQIDVMCKMGPDSISIDENVNMAEAKKITDQYNITIGGNIPLTTTMLFGNQQDNMKSVVELIDSVRAVSDGNFIIAPGCDMPYATPIENTVACVQAIKHPESAREMIKNYETVVDTSHVEIPDYANSEKVIIELFLLDPDQCAACFYMRAAVQDVYDQIKDIAEYRIYKYCVKEDIPRYVKMGLKNLPTMTIDGEPKYISLIPSAEELISVVKEYAAKKKK